MRMLITGSRNLTDDHAAEVYEALDDAYDKWVVQHGEDKENVFVHGNARGADAIGAQWAVERGWVVEAHPAQWDEYGKSAGYIRNTKMVDTGVELCVAFPYGDSYGTRNCIKIALSKKVPVIVHEFYEHPTLF